MDSITENPKFQDSSFDLQKFLTSFCYMANCQRFCTAKGINQQNASLIFDFSQRLLKAEKLYKAAYGPEWFDTPIFKWVNLYNGQKKTINTDTHLTDKWQYGRGLSARQVFECIANGENYIIKNGNKYPCYHIAQFPEKIAVIDVDIHGETEAERAEEKANQDRFLQYIVEQGLTCLCEPTQNGLHFEFLANPSYQTYKPGFTAAAPDGKPFSVEWLACVWNEEAGKYDNARSCILGVNRVNNYTDKIVWLGDGDPDICPSELYPAKERTADLQPTNVGKPSKNGISREAVINAKPGNRNDKLYKYLCKEAAYLPNSEEGKAKLRETAISVWNDRKDNTSFPVEEAIRIAESASEHLGEKDSEKAEKPKLSNAEKIMNCVKAFAETNPDVYYSQERQEMFLVENGLLKRTYPEIIPTLWPDQPYSSTMVKLLYSELLHTFGTDRLLGSDQSISSLTPASTCLLQDGTVLTIQDFKPRVMKFSEWQGKPFFSRIKANFDPELCTAGYNYDLEVLKQKAPKFFQYLHTSIDLAEARQRLCQMIGAVLTPVSSPSLPGVWNLIGNAGCGKSVITKFLKHIHPEEARAQIEPPTKYKRWGLSSLATSERAPHYLYTPDTSTADCYDSDYFKQIVFGDPIRVENKGVKPITIDKPLTWVISTNNHLKFRSDREQLEDKIPEIPFQTRINYRKERPAEYDEYLDYTLYKEEASQIVSFCWGVFARTVIQQEPVNFKLRQHTLEGELELNDLLKFLTKHVSYDPNAETPITDKYNKNGDKLCGIFQAFQVWMDHSGLQKWTERDINGGVCGQPSQEFMQTFRRWLKANGYKSLDTPKRFGTVFKAYPLTVHLDYENEQESLKDSWACSWEQKSAKEIYSEAFAAILDFEADYKETEQKEEEAELLPPALPSEIRIIHVSETMGFSEAVHYETTYPYTTPEPTDPVMEPKETISDPAPAMTAEPAKQLFYVEPTDNKTAEAILTELLQPGDLRISTEKLIDTLAEQSRQTGFPFISPLDVYAYLSKHSLGNSKQDHCDIDRETLIQFTQEGYKKFLPVNA